jgi:hypothetical protein
MPVTGIGHSTAWRKCSALVACRIIAITSVAMMFVFAATAQRLQAAITGQFISSYSITFTVSDLGLSASGMAIPEGGITSIQQSDGSMVNTPSTITIPVIVTVYSKPVGTSYTDYFWRLKMNDTDHTNWVNNNRTVSPAYTIRSTTDSVANRLSKTTSPLTATIPVSITTSPTQVFTQSGTSWYLYQQSTLSIDLSNVSYSGTYSGTVTTTLTY